MPGFTKLFSSIITSTIWSEDDKTRIVWITMLALADQRGFVDGTVPGLAAMARVTVDECRAAIGKLEGPDRDSRNDDHEGRRIKKVQDGWTILNHSKYREKLSADERREYKAEWARRKRGLQVDKRGQPVDGVDTSRSRVQKQSTEAEEDSPYPSKSRWCAPSREEVHLIAVKAGMPETEEEKFWHHYCANGWMVGKNRMKSLSGAVGYWMANYRQGTFQNNGKPTATKPDYSKGF